MTGEGGREVKREYREESKWNKETEKEGLERKQ